MKRHGCLRGIQCRFFLDDGTFSPEKGEQFRISKRFKLFRIRVYCGVCFKDTWYIFEKLDKFCSEHFPENDCSEVTAAPSGCPDPTVEAGSLKAGNDGDIAFSPYAV